MTHDEERMTTPSFPPLNDQMDLIRRGTVEVLPEEDLVRKIERSIATGTPLNVKLGADPSAPDLHIGHAVVLQKLRDFQDLGHQAILIVGDFTAMIGDPTGRSKTRPALTLEQTRTNGQSYFQQAEKILSPTNIRIVYNSDWLGGMTFAEVIAESARFTVSQMLERDDFHRRFDEEAPISLHEFLYPLAQALDSVHIKSDVELGGTEQRFNLLMGRSLQRDHGQDPQAIITMPLLVGTDGVEKMSKSLGNYIGLDDAPADMYGKLLSIADTMMPTYARLALFRREEEVVAFERGLADGSIHPRDAKRTLARDLVARYAGPDAAARAEEEFDRVFIRKDAPEEMPEFAVAGERSVVDVIVEAGLAPSKGEARRLIVGGGVSIDGAKVEDVNALCQPTTPAVLKVGKRRFVRLVSA